MFKSQWRDLDRDWKDVSLYDETKTETAKMWVLIMRPKLKNQSVNDDTETKTEKSESQKRDWSKDVYTDTPSRLLLITDSPLVGRGMIFAPWKEFYMIHVFWLVDLDFFLFDAVKSKLSLINELILIQFILFG